MNNLTNIFACEPRDHAVSAAGAELHVTGAILLVEDVPLVRKAAAEALQTAGYEVIVASNAAEALKLCSARAQEIALLLSDIVMPGMNGCELAKSFLHSYPQAQVLLMSGYAPELSPSLSANSYLSKPFSASTLVQAVREALQQNATP